MKIRSVAIPVAGVVVSVLLAFSAPPEHQVYWAEFAGLIALGLGAWQANNDSQPDATNDRPA